MESKENPKKRGKKISIEEVDNANEFGV